MLWGDCFFNRRLRSDRHPNSSSLSPLILLCDMLFSFIGKWPPRKRISTIHKMNDRHKHINNTGIKPFPWCYTKRLIQFKRFFSNQFLWMINTNQLEMTRHRSSDIWKINKSRYYFSVWVLHMFLLGLSCGKINVLFSGRSFLRSTGRDCSAILPVELKFQILPILALK